MALTLASGCSLLLAEETEDTENTIDAGTGEVDAGLAAPFLPGWRARKRLVADPMVISLESFILLVVIDGDADLRDARASDIRFTTANGITILPHQIHQFDPSRGDLIAWVRLDGSERLFLYYDNPEQPVDEFDPYSEFAGVWHLDEDATGIGNAAIYQDSTLNDNHGNDFVSGDAIAGHVLEAPALNGTSDTIVVLRTVPWSFEDGGLDNGLSDLTISAWVRPAVGGDPIGTIVRKGASGPSTPGYWFAFDAQQRRLQLYTSDGSAVETSESEVLGAMTIDDGQWHHVAAVLERQDDNDVVRFYSDGELVGENDFVTHAQSEMLGATDFAIGANVAGDSRQWAGGLDEVSIAKVARTTSFIEASFANQRAPTEFVTVGSMQPAP